MLPSHCLPTCAVCLPHLRSPCSSMTSTPSSLGTVVASANNSSRRRSLVSWGSHPDSDRNHCKLCASFRCAPATGSVLARAVRVLLRWARARKRSSKQVAYPSRGPGDAATGSLLVIVAPPYGPIGAQHFSYFNKLPITSKWLKSSLERLSEKGYKQYSGGEYGWCRAGEIGRNTPLRRPGVLRCRLLQGFSDSLRRGILGSSLAGSCIAPGL